MNMADKIDILMKRNNIKNPKELSEKLDQQNLKIPYTTLLTIINNEVQDIKLGTARKLCDFFNITLDELLDDEISLEDTDIQNTNFRTASYNGIDVDGLDEDEIQHLNELVEFYRNKKKNK